MTIKLNSPLTFSVKRRVLYISNCILSFVFSIRFVLLLFECLTEMFRETELLASRMNRLKTKK